MLWEWLSAREIAEKLNSKLALKLIYRLTVNWDPNDDTRCGYSQVQG